jgi:3-oxoacyl-[acyl-carrier protein] reductase
MRFRKKTAVVTGGGRGIGKGIAQGLASEGASVVVSDIDIEAASQTSKEIESLFDIQAFSLGTDVRKRADIFDLVEFTKKQLGSIDIFCSIAGICTSTRIADISEEEWDNMIDTNLRSVFFCSQAVMPVMKEQRRGRILNMASLAGKVGGLAAGAHYSASKAGVICLTKSFARELAPYGVTVNALAPGPIETAMLDTLPPDLKGEVMKQCPLGRFGDVADVAGAALFLLSDAARHITGATLDINGGLLMD